MASGSREGTEEARGEREKKTPSASISRSSSGIEILVNTGAPVIETGAERHYWVRNNFFDFLKKHPRNISAAAESVGISRDEGEELIKQYPEMFRDIWEAQLDQMEEYAALGALGKKLPEGVSLNFTETFKVLSIFRGDVWGTKRLGKKRLPVKPNGLGIKMLQDRKKNI